MEDISLRPVTRDEEVASFPVSMKDCPPPYTLTYSKEENANDTRPCYKKLFCCCQNTCNSIKSKSLLPSWTSVSRFITLTILALMIWGSAFSELGSIAGLEGQLFKIGFLGASAYVAGNIVVLFGFPNLFGMMAMGIILRNIGFVVISGPFVHVTAALRKIALFVILTSSGLELDPVALKKLCGMVARIVVVPAVTETVAIAVATHFLLNLPWIWGFLLGSVLAAISPDVIIPCIFQLQTIGNYGKSKGIPTLVIASTSFDDIVAITVFSVLLGFITSTGNLTTQLIQGPVAIVIGLACGAALGMLLRYIPYENDKRASMLRTLLLVGGGLMFMFGSTAIGYEGAGPLGCIVVAFVASNGWNPYEKKSVEENVAIMWEIFQPILFGLIGNEINLYILQGDIVGLGVVSVLLALGSRMLASIVVAAGGNFNWKEKAFISVALFPKATVQAALGPVALSRVKELNLVEMVPHAEVILMIAVLSILITAPLGGIVITSLGPKLLKKEDTEITTGQPISIHL